MTRGRRTAVHLRRTDENVAEIDVAAERVRAPGRASAACSPTSTGRPPRARVPGRRSTWGFRWNRRTTRLPSGGGRRASPPPPTPPTPRTSTGRRLLVTSWYSKDVTGRQPRQPDHVRRPRPPGATGTCCSCVPSVRRGRHAAAGAAARARRRHRLVRPLPARRRHPARAVHAARVDDIIRVPASSGPRPRRTPSATATCCRCGSRTAPRAERGRRADALLVPLARPSGVAAGAGRRRVRPRRR